MTQKRNEKCFCGSGKKFKQCHGDISNFPPESLASMLVDHDAKTIVGVTKDVLVKQFHRDGPKIAKSFDQLTEFDIGEISAMLARSMILCYPHKLGANPNDKSLHGTCSRLLGYAISTFNASAEVARHGFRRQYGTTMRGVVETLSTIILLNTNEKALAKFHDGDLKSPDSITVAKKVFPPFGHLYGLLSNHFVHINKDSTQFEALVPFTPEDEALPFIIANMRAVVWLMYVVAELVFFDYVVLPDYWKRVEGIAGAFSFQPNETGLEERRRFLMDMDEMQARLKNRS